MTKSEKQSWQEVQAKGRDRLLMRSIARGGWFFVGGVVVEFIWWMVTKKVPEPLMATTAKWALVALGTGLIIGCQEWKTNESAFQKSEDESEH